MGRWLWYNPETGLPELIENPYLPKDYKERIDAFKQQLDEAAFRQKYIGSRDWPAKDHLPNPDDDES